MPLYNQEFLADNLPLSAPAGSKLSCHWAIRNASAFRWESEPASRAFVVLALSIGGVYRTTALPTSATVEVSDVAHFHCILALPEEPGTVHLSASLVHHQHAYFTDHGAEVWRHSLCLVRNERAGEERAVSEALAANYSYFLPAGGIVSRRDGGRWPGFIRQANGARVQTTDGSEYIDHLMGWGSALLGHGHPAIAEAIRRELDGGNTNSLPHIDEVETGQALLKLFPQYEMVQFGKNGSDVCTLAVRMMRVHTGRPKILYWGYHGWQDWFTARLGFGQTGVLPSPELYGFSYGDAGALERYLEANASEVAGIIMEPCAAVLGPHGPIPEIDSAFLRAVRQICHHHGLLLAFDEIYTGFRHPGGSAQMSVNVIPDITLLGKGLAAGFPLGAMLTHKWLFESTANRVMYGPTYKGERVSLIACRTALNIFNQVDVPAHVNAFGQSLKEAVGKLPATGEMGLKWIGPPYRQMAVFTKGDSVLRQLRKNLLLQELLRAGILSYKGLFLPSLAHGNAELEETVSAFHSALTSVAEAGDGPQIVRLLELPPAC